MLLWSAATGLVMGLLAGIGGLAVLTLAVNVIPGIPERLVERLRLPVLVVLLAGVPLAGAVLGFLEGRAKLP
jgi:Na+-translocating ferredoxin:NAD+ oxidoreductase RnfE subunit